jgi:DNA-binding transcriptional ArsR family regulator
MPRAPVPPPAAGQAAIRLSAALRRGADRLLPSAVAAWRLSRGFTTTRTLAALARHGVFDALDAGPRTAAQLAAQLGLDPDALHRLLRAAATDGVVRLDRRGRFRLTRIGRRLRTGDPLSLRSWALHLDRPATQDAWAAVGTTLRTGEPAFPAAHGRSVWEHLAAHPDEEAEFAAAMRTLTRMVTPYVVAAYPWPERGTVCDVGGGVGTLLAAVLAARPGLRGVLVDAPGVLARARAPLADAGVADRVVLRAGDIFTGIDARADLYLLKDVLHDWDDERALRILRTVRAAMPAGARVLLVETLQDRNRPDPVASVVDVHMLTQCDGGRQRSAGELRALLAAAGLRPGAVHRSAGPAIVEGEAQPDVG